MAVVKLTSRIILHTIHIFSLWEEELPKALPEFEVDYTPLFVLPYSKLPNQGPDAVGEERKLALG